MKRMNTVLIAITIMYVLILLGSSIILAFSDLSLICCVCVFLAVNALQVIDAKTPQAMLVAESEDSRVDSR